MIVKPFGAAIALLLGLAGTVIAGPVSASPSPLATAALPAATSTTSLAAATGDDIAVNVTPGNLGSLTDGDQLRLTVTIANSSASSIQIAEVTASINRARLTTRNQLDTWFAATDATVSAPSSIARETVSAINPNETRTIQLAVPASSLGFTSAGVYPVLIGVVSNGAVIGSARTAVVWKVDGSKVVKLAVAAPLVVPTAVVDPTTPAPTSGLIDAATLESYTAPDGLLTTQLNAMARSGVTIGVDPRILASIRVLGTAAPQSALDWVERLRFVSNDTFPLNYADADATLMLQAGGKSLVEPTSFDFAIDAGRFATPEPTPTDGSAPAAPADPTQPQVPTLQEALAWNYSIPSVSWPTANAVTKSNLESLVNSGASTVILSSGNVTQRSPLANAAAVVDTANVVVADDSLSGLLNDAVTAPSLADWSAATARLSAAVAITSNVARSGAPTLLATVGRSWPTTGYRLEQTLAALNSNPWVVGTSLQTAITSASSPGSIADRPETADRLSQATLMRAAEVRENRFSAIVEDPLALTAERRLALMSLLSNAWVDDPDGWDAATDAFLDESQAMVSSVKIAESSTVTLANSSGSLPVSVSNSYTQPVTVYVQVRPQTALIAVDEPSVKITIEPGSLHKAQIPVQSLSNGTVELTVSLADELGRIVGTPTEIKMNVHADWESLGTVIFGAFVVVIFGIGIIRTIRKRRRRAGTVDAPEATTDATPHE
ncbi:DUF6049 family protein [Glaciihabitans sp. dw_435]|uniref:DUF6049 family protein n=1 Tax=Glaciihabitans sp. dw_435 TaxID=2720081 RepID=UPI001BD5A88E|nr:DUF6049 family protein [Glaciihabitans sp. dw_435]